MKVTFNNQHRTFNAECPVRLAHSLLDVECSEFNVSRSAARRPFGFTLIELLVVISILGILAALTVPALKDLGKSNTRVSASRQLLDDVGRARQLAMSHHTTVYMVFVPTNYFNLNNVSNQNILAGLNDPLNIPLAADRLSALTAMTNLVDKQLTGYGYVSHGKVGDQPGQHDWHYLTDWQSLPDGAFIAAAKFLPQTYNTAVSQWQKDYAGQIDTAWMNPFGYRVNQLCGFALAKIPFPTEVSPLVWMPCLTFDHTGRLISEVDAAGSYHHAYIPLAQGTVTYGRDINKQPTLATVQPADITETPLGNSTNISYSIVDIDRLTGRATLLRYKMP